MSVSVYVYVRLIILFSYFSLDVCLYHDHVECGQIYCGCVFPNGYGIDLKMLNTADFQLNVTNVGYHLKLCSDVPFDNTTCSSTSFYALHFNGTNDTRCENLGSSKDMKFVWERIADDPQLQFVKDNVTSVFSLVCEESSGKNVLQLIKSSEDRLEFRLLSKGVCPGYITTPGSGGTNIIAVLFIIVLVVFLLYMCVGMLVLKFIRGAEGIEIIPNHEFWMSIPMRSKSLLLFCVAGCKSPPTYDRI